MANEITSNFSLSVSKGSLTFSRSLSKQITISASSPNVAGGTQAIGTAAAGEAIVLGDVATNGVAYFVNLDATNFIEIGIQNGGTFYPLLRFNAGEGGCMRLAQGVTPYARANTSSAILEYHIFDN
jgi:hypothetical protein